MNDYVKKAYDNISNYLNDNYKDMYIDCILYDEKTHATYTTATDGNEKCFSFDPYSKYEPDGYDIIPEWDYNFDYYVYDLLEKGCDIGYMTDEMHYGIWNSINELYPNDIEYKDGVLNYVEYCKKNNITKEYIDSKVNLETPDIMPLFNNDKLKVLYIEPNKLPEVIFIDKDLESMQQTVSYGDEGLIETVYLQKDNNVVLVCNEEGKINGMKPNRDIGHDIIYGPFFIAAIDKSSDEFKSLSDEQILNYKIMFDKNSIMRTENKITAIKMMNAVRKINDYER